MPIELRPCPFCGGTRLYMDNMDTDDHCYHFVVCKDCMAEGPVCAVSPENEDKAVALARRAWNGDIER